MKVEHVFDGTWISKADHNQDSMKGSPAPYFRRSFHLPTAPVSAEILFCGLGFGELRVNGHKISDDVLQPPFTRFDATVLYAVYDAAALLTAGENIFGVILGNGMYNAWAPNAWSFEHAPWRSHPRMSLSARIVLPDGKRIEVRSDEDFKVSSGPVLSESLYEGEIYDARLEMPGWDTPGFDDAAWSSAVQTRAPGGIPRPMEMERCRIVRRIGAVSMHQVNSTAWVYDFGENIAGWASVRTSGPAGTQLKLSFSEQLAPDGDIDTSQIDQFSVKGRFQTDVFMLKGSGIETWEPKFTYHGFQYARLEANHGIPTLDTLTACEVHTDLPTRGILSCSDPMVERIHMASRLSTAGNFVGIPTDCPHREKNGWTGDAVLSAEQVLLNFDPTRAYRKWLRDIVDCQRADGQIPGIVPTGGWGYAWGNGPAWDSALVLIPWYLYIYEGDFTAIEEFYEPIRRYVECASLMAKDGILDYGLGDWCPPRGAPYEHRCPTRITDTAIHATNTRILSRMALLLGKEEDGKRYTSMADATRKAFQLEFVDKVTGGVESDCQTSYACALYHGMVKGQLAGQVFERLVAEVERCDRHIDCGILGAKYVPRVLTIFGRADLAYAVATNPTFPGWGYWMAQGATTLWENWNGEGSRNHHMFSDIDGWFYSGLAGIQPDPDHPGFRHTIFRPSPIEAIKSLEAIHEAPVGRVACAWRLEGTILSVTVEVPEGCSGDLVIPPEYAEKAQITLKGDVRVLRR